MRLGTVVQGGLLGGLGLVFVWEMAGALVSAPCDVARAKEFLDPQTMYSAVCQVELQCPDGAWSGEMETRGRRRHRECARVGEVVRRSPLWRSPRYDGPMAGFFWTFVAGALALVAVPAAGYWLNPRERLADHDPSFRRR